MDMNLNDGKEWLHLTKIDRKGSFVDAYLLPVVKDSRQKSSGERKSFFSIND